MIESSGPGKHAEDPPAIGAAPEIQAAMYEGADEKMRVRKEKSILGRLRKPFSTGKGLRTTFVAASLTSLILTGQTSYDALTSPQNNPAIGEPGSSVVVDTNPETEQEKPLNQQLDTLVRSTAGLFFPEVQTDSETRRTLEAMKAQMEIKDTTDGTTNTRTGTTMVPGRNSESSTRYQVSYTVNPDTQQILSVSFGTRVGVDDGPDQFLTPSDIVYFNEAEITSTGDGQFRVTEKSGYGTPDSWTPTAVTLTTGEVDPRFAGQQRAMTQADVDALTRRRDLLISDITIRRQAQLNDSGQAPFPYIEGIATS